MKFSIITCWLILMGMSLASAKPFTKLTCIDDYENTLDVGYASHWIRHDKLFIGALEFSIPEKPEIVVASELAHFAPAGTFFPTWNKDEEFVALHKNSKPEMWQGFYNLFIEKRVLAGTEDQGTLVLIDGSLPHRVISRVFYCVKVK